MCIKGPRFPCCRHCAWSCNKSRMKITMPLALPFTLTSFKKSAEHRVRGKSSTRCGSVRKQHLSLDILLLTLWLFSSLCCGIDRITLTGEIASLSEPIHSLQINSCLFPLQLNESLKRKWDTLQFRQFSLWNRGSFVWRKPSRLSDLTKVYTLLRQMQSCLQLLNWVY